MPDGCQLLIYNFDLYAGMYRLLIIGLPAFFLSLLPFGIRYRLLFLSFFTFDVFQRKIRSHIQIPGRIEFV